MNPVGRLYGIGLGPGDPELLTLKALRLLQNAPHVAYFAKAGRRGHARTIADPHIRTGTHEIAMFYPVTTEIHFAQADYNRQLANFYEESATRLAALLSAGEDVALICEGDPLFYGSFMHLYIRLRAQFPVTIVPAVTGMSGCWSAAGEPMTWGDDILTVLPGTLSAEALKTRLHTTDAAVIMKIGQNFTKIKAAIAECGLLERAIYVERGAMKDEKVVPLAQKTDEIAPYFSIILIPGNGRRPDNGQTE